ncbi:MAG: cyanophycin synthetase, partial [Isosphaeraceae bacterium]
MEFRKVRALNGPNVWSRSPALEAWVDLGPLKMTPPGEVPGLADQLLSWLPGMVLAHGQTCECGGWASQDIGWARVLEAVTRELLGRAWKPVEVGWTRATAEHALVQVVVPMEEEQLARACLDTARALILAAVDEQPFEVETAIRPLRRLAQHNCMGPSTGAIVRAAERRGIPSRRMGDCSLFQLGHAVRQRRIWTAETDRTGSIAEMIAKDKELTRMLLQAVGVAVPDGRPVADAEDAWTAAQRIGLPVVVKPRDGNHGRGVATDLRTRDQVVAAFHNAKAEGDHVLVERFAPGDDYRLLVIGGKLAAAARREPAHVIGDGRQSITLLIDEVNLDPRRGEDHATALSKIELDAVALEVLREQEFTPDSVPRAGQRVMIRRNANLSTGGTATDVTDLVHPDIAAQAVAAAQVIGLDIAGVDLVALDISRPMAEQGAVFVEVNAGPGLRMHLEPSAGTPRAVGEMIVETLFPNGQNGRIPIVAVTGVNGKTTTTRLIAQIVATTGKTVGMTCTDGVSIGGRLIERGDCAGPQSARGVLLHPRVQAAVFETARGGILREGLGFDACDVAVVTNIGEGDHLGLGHIHTIEELARVKRTIVENLLPGGTAVLKADDPLVAAMADHCPGSVLFFARDGADPVLVAHRQNGGRAAFVVDGVIVLAEGDVQEPLISLDRVPLTLDGRVEFQVENVLAAAGAAWALGIDFETIVETLESFDSTPALAPGRFNVLQAAGATVIVDYGHNPSAVAALADAVEAFPRWRRLAVFSAAGDRRDLDIIQQGEILGATFDRVCLYEEAEWRYERAEGEIRSLLRKGLTAGTRVAEIDDFRIEREAVASALQSLQSGDLLLIQATDIQRTVATVQAHLDAMA